MAGLPKILLVEDTVEIADIYSQLLSKRGFEIQLVRTVVEQLAMVGNYAPEIIFLDIAFIMITVNGHINWSVVVNG